MICTSMIWALHTAVLSTVLIAAAPSVTSAQPAAPDAVSVDRQSSTIGFTVSARMLFSFKREGRFNEFSGVVAYDPAHLDETRVDLTVYTASIDTKHTDENELLRSIDFFDVDHFPTMHFVSTGANPQSNGALTVTGDLTIRGITKRIVVPVKVLRKKGNSEAAATLETRFEIDRADFGLTGRPTWGVSIGRRVQIHLAIATNTAVLGTPK